MRCIFDKTHNYDYNTPIVIPVDESSDSSDESGESSNKFNIEYKTEVVYVNNSYYVDIPNRYLSKFLFETKCICKSNPDLKFYVTKIIGNKYKLRFILNAETFNNQVELYYKPILESRWSIYNYYYDQESSKFKIPHIIDYKNTIWIDSDNKELPINFYSIGESSYIVFEDSQKLNNLSLYYISPYLSKDIITIPLNINMDKVTIEITGVGFIVAGLYVNDVLDRNNFIKSCYYSGNKVIFLFNKPINNYYSQLIYYYTLKEPTKSEIYIE